VISVISAIPVAGAVCATGLALAVALRARGWVAQWAFIGGMTVLAVECAISRWGLSSPRPDLIVRAQLWRLAVISLLPGFWLVFSLTYSRGNAVEFLSRWRYIVAGALVLPPVFVLLFRNELITAVYLVRPTKEWILRLGWAGIALYLFELAFSLLVLANLERTLRASVGTIRWRIKYMILGVGALFVVRLYTTSEALLFRCIDLPVESLNAAALLVATLLILRSSWRSQAAPLDVYPSHSLIQGSITILAAGIYFLLVGAFARVVAHVGGDAGFALKTFLFLISLVVLIILLQSDRVRRHLGQFVSRNFQRPLYDYRTVWRQFTEGTASRVEQSDLCRTLVKLTADLFQCLSVSVWQLEDKNETLILTASTFLSEAQGRDLRPSKEEMEKIIAVYQTSREPIDFEETQKDWANILRRMHPSEFPRGGHRVCLPLVGRGEVFGLIILGDRVAGAAFTAQDFDMLKCVGDHATASLLNVQLSRRLLQAKEFEAFQTMAAFFVHDLKNAASTLNLMLQNLPVHFDDPAFRADALRGVSKTVDHINDLIGRLTLLRHELRIQPADADLNEVVTKAIAGLDSGSSPLVRDLSPIPSISLDREQIIKVVTNLVLNAQESSGGVGEVRVATKSGPGWAVIEVADQGEGMSAEFVERSLFRPFQTTKKKGLGIGMFQSKMIVEAHSGRIAVTSAPGKGTTFQVFLPLTKPVK